MSKLVNKIRNWTIGLGVAAAIVAPTYSYFVPQTIRTKITDAQMVKVDGRFMIATEDQPFQNYDAWYRFKFNSGTIQNEAIRLRGKMVDIRAYGWRNALFSTYENIVDVQEVKGEK